MYTWLNKLSLFNFKNYSDTSFSFCKKINCLTGNNGTGKTNVLDALYYLSLCKSYNTNIDSQNIKHGEELFTIQGEYTKEGKSEQIFCGVKQGQKKIFKRNGKEYERLADHIGFIPVVIVSPSDSCLITEGSEERRRFLDSVLSQYDCNYLNDVMRYNRALLQRNMLLKDFDIKNWFDPDMLAMWDEQLIETGIRIHKTRVDFFQEILPVFQQYYEYISGGLEKVELIYESQLLYNSFSDILSASITKDRKVLYTTSGIHKDDLLLNLEGFPIKKTGSQGQQKTFLVALKMAQFEFIKKKSGNYPILLLDDIFDKFDNNRVNKIIDLVSKNDFGQIFITDTSYHRMKEILQSLSVEFQLFQINNGEIITES